VRDRCLATADAEALARAESAVPELSVETVENARDISELARSYATVIVLDESFAGLDVEGDVHVPDALDKPAETVPERLLAFFAANRERLEAAAAVHETANLSPRPTSTASATPSRAARRRRDGRRRRELERLTAADDLDAAVSTAESVADDRLREAIRERDVTIEGTDFLSLVEQGARVDSLLDRELADDEYDAAMARARESTSRTRSAWSPRRRNSPTGCSATTPLPRSSTMRARSRGSAPSLRRRATAGLPA